MPLNFGKNTKTVITTKYLRFDPNLGWVEDKEKGTPLRIKTVITEKPELPGNFSNSQ